MKKSDEFSDAMTANQYQDYVDPIEGGRRGFVNQCNFCGCGTAEKYTKPSVTVPDMSLSLRQMLERHKAGGNVKTFHVANVPQNSMIPDDFERMSQIDREVLKGQVADFIATTRGRMITAREAQRRAQFQKLIDAEAEKRLKALAEVNGGTAPSEQP